MRKEQGFGWYATFALLMVVAFIAVYYLTGRDALGATTRFLWNGLVVIINSLIRLLSSLLGLLAKGVGWRRLSRLSSALAGVGLGYAGSVILSDNAVHTARGWRGKLNAARMIARSKWHSLPLSVKLLVVAVLIASQLYVHSLLIIFPIAFLVPVVRRLWVRSADLLLSGWYWRTLGDAHRTAVNALTAFPVTRPIIGGVRLTRIRYLCAWRLWRYHPRYRDPETNNRWVSFLEPVRLWWRGELDGYVGRPLLSGQRPTNQIVTRRAYRMRERQPKASGKGRLRKRGLIVFV